MPTLEEVEAAFREWRTTKRKKWDRIPEELLSMARSLVGEHTAGTISFRLGITADKLQVAKEVVAADDKFVEISGPEIVLADFIQRSHPISSIGTSQFHESVPPDFM